VTIDGLDGETVLEEAAAHDSVEECRLIHDGEEGCTIEMRLSQSGIRTLTNHGATIRDVSVEGGVGTCLVEVSQDADIREIAEALTVIYENTELVARREVDRPVRTAAERRNRILDGSLTASSRRCDLPTTAGSSTGRARVPARISPTRWTSRRRRCTSTCERDSNRFSVSSSRMAEP